MKKIMLVILIIILVLGLFLGYLWLISTKKYDVEYGISFNKQHAESLKLDWKEVYLAMLEDLKPKYIRIAATWSEVESDENQYNFSDVNWQMDMADKYGTKVVLVVGQKAPRWPECHVPEWVDGLSDEGYEKEFFDYVKHVVELYSKHPALEIWQVENEPFIKFRFGECEKFREDLVKPEIKLVKELDPNHKIIITDSGELSTWWDASRSGDLFGTTLYRIVRMPNGMVWSYGWIPPAFYRVKAEILGKNISEVFVSELQAEPWFFESDPSNTSIEEQEKTMNVSQLKKHFDYTERVGVSRAYLWGVEWWYWMKDVQGNSKYWKIVQEKM